MDGGCLCGAVRYRLASEPFDTGWCHCRLCQRASGAPAIVATTVPLKDFIVERGAEALGEVRPTSFGVRRFCTRCGTPLTFHVDHQPDTIDVTVATLDDPTQVQPGFHIFYKDALPWAEINDGLPRHPEFRPDTRGLS